MKRYTRKEAFANSLAGAKGGDSGDQNFVGYCFDTGWGVAKDHKKAVYWYSIAARNGNIHGIFNFALSMSKGRGIRRNPVRAMELYKQAAERGDLQSQTNLACMLLDGDGVKSDFAVGMKWMRLAARRGDSRAQYNLGRAYAEGENGICVSTRFAKVWLLKAAESDHYKARRLLDSLNRRSTLETAQS
jgi:TPR repeat protein